MATADKLNKLLETKAAIRQAIIDKGVDVGEDVVFADYPAKISTIQSGGSGDDFYGTKTLGGTDYSYLFYHSSAERIPDFSTWDTSNVTTMEDMFSSCDDLTELNLSNFNTSNVTNMCQMFYQCTNLTSLDLSSFDTSKVTNMGWMFSFCKKLTTIEGLNSFNTSNVTATNSLFYDCESLIELNLSNWDTSKVTNMNQMFNGCKNLTTITGELDASKVSDGFFYISSTYNPFGGCTLLETVYLKNIYKDITNMTNNSKWSISLGDTKVKDECLIYIINELPDLINDKGLTATDKIILTLPTTNTLTQAQVQVAIDKGWNVANTTY